MGRRIGVLLTVAIAVIGFLYTVQAQTGEKKWKKTVTLTNGEVVCELNGEWNVFVENYGAKSFAGSYPQICKITQEGSSFVGVRMIDDPWNNKGSQSIKGELDKSGIRKVTIFAKSGPVEAKGQISDDGNKMIIDDGENYRLTLTRK